MAPRGARRALAKHAGTPLIDALAGDHSLRYLVEFTDWASYFDATQMAQDAGERFFRLRSPIEQYLARSGRTLFKAMRFSDLRRLQIDIETIGFDPRDPASQVIVIALKCGGVEEVLAQESDELSTCCGAPRSGCAPSTPTSSRGTTSSTSICRSWSLAPNALAFPCCGVATTRPCGSAAATRGSRPVR